MQIFQRIFQIVRLAWRLVPIDYLVNRTGSALQTVQCFDGILKTKTVHDLVKPAIETIAIYYTEENTLQEVLLQKTLISRDYEQGEGTIKDTEMYQARSIGQINVINPKVNNSVEKPYDLKQNYRQTI